MQEQTQADLYENVSHATKHRKNESLFKKILTVLLIFIYNNPYSQQGNGEAL